MQQSLARIQPQFDSEELDVIRRTVASKTNKDQFALFIQVCKYSGLNPFARQIYAVVRNNEMTVQTGIDGYRILAERSGKYAGQLGPQWCGEDEVWKDVWLSSKPPAAARVGVLRRDFDQPIWGVAKYTSYEQPSSPLWRKMGEVMIAKCAESLALRKAFPAEMAGIYTSEEMAQADSSIVASPVTSTTVVEQTDELGEIVESHVEPEPVQEVPVRRTSTKKEDDQNTPPTIAELKKVLADANLVGSDGAFMDWKTFLTVVYQADIAAKKYTVEKIVSLGERGMFKLETRQSLAKLIEELKTRQAS
jgi:phage recombination protein Bet